MINAKLTDLSLGAGLKGKIGSKWNYDLSEVIGTNAFRLDMKNTHNTSLGNIGAFSFPDKDIQQKTEMYDGTLHFTQATTNFDMNRSFLRISPALSIWHSELSLSLKTIKSVLAKYHLIMMAMPYPEVFRMVLTKGQELQPAVSVFPDGKTMYLTADPVWLSTQN